ncbi:MAG: glycosyltransferase, partial [Pseudomonadota bacterium]
GLDRGVPAAVQRAGGRSLVMVHDVIPLDHSAFTRPEPRVRFEGALRAVSAHADRVIHISHTTRRRAERWFERFGRVPDGVVIPPGVPELGPRMPAADGGFCVIGTIEARKNVGFLLDLWEAMGAETPRLHIIGRRGWGVDDLIRRLDALPRSGPVIEHGPLPDAEAQRLLRRSAGLLFPSHAEGYGLPVAEALQIGVPVICNDIEELRESFGGHALFHSVADPEGWISEIRQINSKLSELNAASVRETGTFLPQRWDNHFVMVNDLLT